MTPPGAMPAPPRGLSFDEGPVRVLLGAATFLFVLVLWEETIRLFDVPVYVVPKPSAAFATLFAEWRLILYYGWVTSVEILLGFIAGGIGGAALAIVVHRYRIVEAALNPPIVFFQIIPSSEETT